MLTLARAAAFNGFVLGTGPTGKTGSPCSGPFCRGFTSVLRILVQGGTLALDTIVTLFMTSLIVVKVVPRGFFPSLSGPCCQTSIFCPSNCDVGRMTGRVRTIRTRLLTRPRISGMSVAFKDAPLHCCLTSASMKPGPGFYGVLMRLGSDGCAGRRRRGFSTCVGTGCPGTVAHADLFGLSPTISTTVRVNFVNGGISALIVLAGGTLRVVRHGPSLVGVHGS